MNERRIPVVNRGPNELQLNIEPEGNAFVLQPGEALEIRYFVDGRDEPAIELEVEGRLLAVHIMLIKEVWKDGCQIG